MQFLVPNYFEDKSCYGFASRQIEPVVAFDPRQKRLVAAPIDPGDENNHVFLAIFGTGWQNCRALTSVKVEIDGLPAEAVFAGAQGEFAGLDQINLRLPSELRGRGEVTLQLSVDGRAANPVKLIIK